MPNKPETVNHMLRHRFPWLFLGLVGAMTTPLIVSGFEKVLNNDLRLAFFIPIIVYLGDAIGTQTETIYVRHIRTSSLHFGKYLLKETAVGFFLGAIFGIILGAFSFIWLKSYDISLAVGLAILINITLAPVLATVIPTILYKEKTDPALGAGPLATIIQDVISLVIYFMIADLIIF